MGGAGGGVIRELERIMDIELMLVHQARLFSEEMYRDILGHS